MLSSNEPSLNENKQKFKPSDAENVNNFKESDATNLVSSEVSDTNSIDSSMNVDIVDDKYQENNLSTPEEGQCFPQTDASEIVPSIAKQTGFSQSYVKDLAVPRLNKKDNIARSVNTSLEDNTTESKQLCTKHEANINSKKENVSVRSSIKSLAKPNLNTKEEVTDVVKLYVVENKVKSETSKIDNSIEETDDKKAITSTVFKKEDSSNIHPTTTLEKSETEKVESKQKLSQDKAAFQNLLDIVEKQKNGLASAKILKNKTKSGKNLDSSKKKRLQQIKNVSDDNLIKDLFNVERIVWTTISSLTEYKQFYKIHLQKILEFYTMIQDTLKIIVSMKSKQEKSLKITENESKNLLKSFNKFMDCLENMYAFKNKQGFYLENSVQNTGNEVVQFFESHNCCIDFSNNNYVIL